MAGLVAAGLIGLGALGGLLKYIGVFHDVKPVEEDMPFTELDTRCKLAVGGMKTLSKSFEDVYNMIGTGKDYKPMTRVLAVYFDDPEELVEKYGNDDMMRTLFCIVMDDVEGDARTALEANCEAHGYRKKVIKGTRAMKSTFQIRSNLFFFPSLIVFIKRVYPALNNEFKARGKKFNYSLELYDVNSLVTVYIPLDGAIVDEWATTEVKAADPNKVQVPVAAQAASTASTVKVS